MTRAVIGLLLLSVAFLLHAKEQIYYLDFERVNVTYWNPQYYRFLNLTARRYGRQDPIHYVHAHSDVLSAFGNNVSVDMYVYEFLSNEYRRSFLEVHYKLCEFIDKNKNFLKYVEKFLPFKTCPFPKGVFHFVNMSFPDVPLLRTFPFTKGRLFINASLWETQERLLEGHVDVVIKQRWR